jgi:hypothetical protein
MSKDEKGTVNILKEVPYINNHEELAQYLKPLYIIENCISDEAEYNILRTKLLNLLRGSFVIRECREYPIKFKFRKSDKKVHELQFRHFYINFILWQPFIELVELDVLNETFILDCENDIPYIEDYINYKIIQVLRDYHIKPVTINSSISKVLYNLRNISIDFSTILGLNFTLKTFIDKYNEVPRFRELMECTFDKTMQPHEIEQLLNQYEKEEINIFTSDPNDPIGVILRSGTGIKKKQLVEMTISEGFNPDLNGVTIPIPIQNSTMIGGANKPSYYYIASIASRKSLVSNKKIMGTAGYNSKQLLEIARTVSMSTEVSDCGSKHLITYEIKSKSHLAKLNGKYYKEHESDPDYKLLKSNDDKNLIGKKILVRSAVTCACENPDHVCSKCIGSTAIMNYDIADGLGAFSSEEISKVLQQNILSTKHLLT